MESVCACVYMCVCHWALTLNCNQSSPVNHDIFPPFDSNKYPIKNRLVSHLNIYIGLMTTT